MTKEKTAHWQSHPIYQGDDTSGYIDNNWKCSNCNCLAPFLSYWNIYDLVEICPNCKAKMVYNSEI